MSKDRSTKTGQPSKTVSASELGMFAFCPHAWYLRHIEGRQPTNSRPLAAGRQAHTTHAQQARNARQGLLIGSVLLVIILALIILAILLTTTGQ